MLRTLCRTMQAGGVMVLALQGPALLAYNDAVFSPADFSAIARIGQDSKMGRPAATGRFGLVSNGA
jgi:sacsin